MTAPLTLARSDRARSFVLPALFCILAMILVALSGASAKQAGPPGFALEKLPTVVMADRTDRASVVPHRDRAILDAEEPAEQAQGYLAGGVVSWPLDAADAPSRAADDRPERVASPLPERPPRA